MDIMKQPRHCKYVIMKFSLVLFIKYLHYITLLNDFQNQRNYFEKKGYGVRTQSLPFLHPLALPITAQPSSPGATLLAWEGMKEDSD